MPCVSGLQSREYPTPLRYRPPKRWAALCVLHALRVARERRSKTKEGGGTPFPPFKIRARKTGTALRKNSAACLLISRPTAETISGLPHALGPSTVPNVRNTNRKYPDRSDG